ncbi:tail fiber assembly protein, partial [Enterobacter roggenkampii]|uniref:tail fiber assembly protein n=1 Tax=Enterobacter roggenkampii TaxID=1812935 RepID=UPI002FD0F761
PCSVGWNYDGKEFTPPPEPEKTHEELVAEADAEKQSRLDYAAGKIVVWQTKLLMGRKLTTDETASLNAWMDYIDAVTVIDTETAPEITWPEKPA